MTSFEILLAIIILGLLFDYTNGFHDSANVVSTVIATRALLPIKAIILAALLNFIGATQISRVAETITTGLILPSYASQTMILCALVGAIFWNLLTWFLGIPSSSSYALIGGLIGSCWVHAGKEVIIWQSLVNKVIFPMILSPIAGFFLGWIVMKTIKLLVKSTTIKNNEKLFKRIQIVSASLLALSHGFNDAQKSMAIITLGLFSSGILGTPSIPLWVIAACALMMGLGTASGGMRIVKTVGFKITHLQPVQGFAAESSASCIILLASFLGMPVSSTHMIVGSIAGVGASKGLSAISMPTAYKLIITWILTLPGSAGIAGLLTLYFA